MSLTVAKTQIFQLMLIMGYSEPGLGVGAEKITVVKNRMVRIPANFPKPNTEYKCVCNEKEDMQHIYCCEILNNGRRTKI